MAPPTNTDERDEDCRTVTRADATETATNADRDATADGDGRGAAGADADADADSGPDAPADTGDGGAGSGDTDPDSPDETATVTSTEPDDPVPPERRAMILDRDDHRCQLCRARGPQAGGLAQLEVHHKDPDPDDMDRHDPANLITLCDGCHNWAHKRPTDDDVPIELHDEDAAHMLPHDYEILRVLAEEGPLTTGEIAERITPDHSIIAIRERLWLLMGLDAVVEQRDCQLIDQDATTGEWGLPGQIADSERGRIPEDMQALLQRAHDERVRRALERGFDRQTVAEVFGIHSRTTWHKERRAQAYRFPLGALEGRGPSPQPGRDDAGPSVDTDTNREASDQNGTADGHARQIASRSESPTDGDDDRGRTETLGIPADRPETTRDDPDREPDALPDAADAETETETKIETETLDPAAVLAELRAIRARIDGDDEAV